jgi:PAS domain S-box-containing protein
MTPATQGADPRDIIVWANAEGVILYVSPTCRAMGYEPEALMGRRATDFVHPDDLARFAENTASLFEPGLPTRPRNRVHRFRRGDGGWVWLQGHPMVVTGHDGRPGDVINLFRVIDDWA